MNKMAYKWMTQENLQSSIHFEPHQYRNYSNQCNNDIDYLSEHFQYEEFVKHYFLPNIPCMLRPSFTSHWNSRKDWVKNSNHINFDLLCSKFGKCEVPITKCYKNKSMFHTQEKMKFCEFLQYLRMNCTESNEDQQSFLYLKDWHFFREFKDYEAFLLPHFFSSDWLNEYCDEFEDDDFKFVYIGPKNTWTSFHADVYRSYSWSANIVGRKKWYIFPPGQENFFKDSNGCLPNSIFSVETKNLQAYQKTYNEQYIEVVQNPGEIIFIPSGWHHEVYNMEPTISINHNWFNGFNIDIIWETLKTELENVEKEISDCKDADTYQQDCQVILKANHGIDYSKFFSILQYIASKRLKVQQDDAFYHHALFDLHRLLSVLKSLKKNLQEKNLEMNFIFELDKLILMLDNQQ